MVVLTIPRYRTANRLSMLGLKRKLPVTISPTPESTNAVVICRKLSTVGLIFPTNSPVRKICNAKHTAHASVIRSPIPIEKSLCKDKTAAPTIAIPAPTRLFTGIFFLYITNAINGTITTFVAVKNAFFDGVVYWSAMI